MRPTAVLLCALAGGLSGCTVIYHDTTVLGATLAELEPAELPAERPAVEEASLDEVAASYMAALEVISDPATRQRIAVRLADLQMARSEEAQITGTEQRDYFSEAIDQYGDLLQTPETLPDDATDERLLYQLAKAYALDGRMDESDAALARLLERYPTSQYAAEAYFRRAEYAFSKARYFEAEALYRQVLEQGESSPFHLNAVYMYGWSQFKTSSFEGSLAAFTQVLDRLLSDGEDLAALSDAERNLAEDTLRVMAITFSYMDGPPSVAELYASVGPRPYEYLVYRQLGSFYLDKERFADAAATLQQFIDAYPDSDRAPALAVEVIDVYRRGGLAASMLPAKEAFVRNYGVNSDYFKRRGETERAELILPTLAIYLDELSSFYHAEAQTLAAQAAAGAKNVPPAGPNYLRAADYYDEFATTFPASPRVAEVTVLKGEALLAAGERARAVAAFERVAFDLVDAERGAEAGYAAILALTELAGNTTDPAAQAEWAAHKVRSSISFADYYPADPRATAVLGQAASEVFERGDTAQAVALATRLVQYQPPASTELQRTGWQILAHHRFDSGDYTGAEAAYREVLARLPQASPERAAVQDRIAASVYKNAEQLAATGDRPAAAVRLLDIQKIAPGSEIATTALFDAGNHMMELGEWRQAETIFLEFQQRNPQNPLTASLAPKFVVIYQELEEWQKAADALNTLAAQQTEPEAKRQSIYLAAELYQRAGNSGAAKTQYERYLKAYPQPFDLATEARYQLLTIATAQGNQKERDTRLRELMTAHDRAGGGTDRSRYLAAMAANEFAGREFTAFERIKLKLPIRNSLKAKQKALDQTLKAYRKVLDYNVAEFATEANHRIGDVYAQLSRDLMASERPKGLDELEMEQYEILLEEQAYPFEEKSVELLEANAQRAWSGLYDDWVKQSFAALAKLLPARYGKQEQRLEASDGVH